MQEGASEPVLGTHKLKQAKRYEQGLDRTLTIERLRRRKRQASPQYMRRLRISRSEEVKRAGSSHCLQCTAERFDAFEEPRLEMRILGAEPCTCTEALFLEVCVDLAFASADYPLQTASRLNLPIPPFKLQQRGKSGRRHPPELNGKKAVRLPIKRQKRRSR